MEQMRQQKLQREKEKQARFQEEIETASSSSRVSTPNDPKCNRIRDRKFQIEDSIFSEMGTKWTLTRINGVPKSISGP